MDNVTKQQRAVLCLYSLLSQLANDILYALRLTAMMSYYLCSWCCYLSFSTFAPCNKTQTRSGLTSSLCTVANKNIGIFPFDLYNLKHQKWVKKNLTGVRLPVWRRAGQCKNLSTIYSQLHWTKTDAIAVHWNSCSPRFSFSLLLGHCAANKCISDRIFYIGSVKYDKFDMEQFGSIWS